MYVATLLMWGIIQAFAKKYLKWHGKHTESTIILQEVTFAQARKNCHDQGAELASVLSAGEQGAIVKYLMDPPYSKGIEDKWKTKISENKRPTL